MRVSSANRHFYFSRSGHLLSWEHSPNSCPNSLGAKAGANMLQCSKFRLSFEDDLDPVG
jgi:hypothetical protein